MENIDGIEKDCVDLRNKGFLTEFGKGELHIINIIKKSNEDKANKISNILNSFRLKYFFHSPTAKIEVSEFDKLMEELGVVVYGS